MATVELHFVENIDRAFAEAYDDLDMKPLKNRRVAEIETLAQAALVTTDEGKAALH